MKHKFLKIALLLATYSAVQVVIADENKIALVIGNSDYKNKDLRLQNPAKDAADMKAALEKAGFEVLYQLDATSKLFEANRNAFIEALKKNRDSIGVFYYSGHGMQLDGINYLIPVDAEITYKQDLRDRGYKVDSILGTMEEVGNKANILILDACRNLPLFKGANNAKISTNNAPLGTLVAYATSSGGESSQGLGQENSLYTKYLKQHLFEPGVKILDAFVKIRKEVQKVEPTQISSEVISLTDIDFCLAGCNAKPSVVVNPESSPPLLSFVSGADSVNQKKSYSVKFKATDPDGDLSKILIDWGDDSTPTSKTAKNGSTLTFTHTYKFAGIYDLIATAIDKQKNESETVDKSVEVKEVAAVTPQPAPNPTVKIPEISGKVSSAKVTRGDEITFSATLSSDLPAGYSLKINYGNGFEIMNGSGKAFDLTVIPNASAAYKIGIYDSKNILKGKQFVSNFSVVEPAVVIVQPEPEPEPVVETPKKGDVEKFVSGSKTFSYTKIANDGSELPKTAKLGTGAKDWACTKDNNTGLIWEVKTTDGGLRDKDKTYTNYTADYPKCDWTDCEKDFKDKFGDSTNADGFVKAVNKQSLCGAKDWRLPASEELRGLVSCSDGKYNQLDEATLNSQGYGFICKSNEGWNLNTTSPTINTTYFPNTQESWFWSSSPNAYSSDYAWVVDFGYGNSGSSYESSYYYVRLVR